MVQAFLKKWWFESDFKAPNLPLSLTVWYPIFFIKDFELSYTKIKLYTLCEFIDTYNVNIHFQQCSESVQNLFRIFRNVQNLFKIFSNFQNFQNLFRIFSNVQNLFRIFSNVQNLFRIFSEFLVIFRIFRHFSEYLAYKLVYSESLDFVVYRCPQLSEVYFLRKPSTIRVTQLLHLEFYNYR